MQPAATTRNTPIRFSTRLSAISAHGTVLRDCVAEGIFWLRGQDTVKSL